MPELLMPYLWDRLLDAGLCGQGMAGPVPLSFAEMQAWSAATCQPMSAWEARTLRAASRAYVSQCCSDDPALPYGNAELLADEDVVEDKLTRMFDRLARPLAQR